MIPYTQIQSDIRMAVEGLRSETRTAFDRHAAGVRKLVEERMAQTDQRLRDLATIADALKIGRSGSGVPDVVRIEDIPGKRVPYDLLIDIPIVNGSTTEAQQSATITQEGPFVAVARVATFLSAHQFQVDGEDGPAAFVGRSYGRFRPIHSADDWMDGHGDAVVSTANPMAAGTYVASIGLPNAISNFRSMQFDGRLRVVQEGSGYPRQWTSAVPTSIWQRSSPQDLGCLDFFERGEAITVKVTPTHTNNQSAGNVNGENIFGGVVGWPFLDGQFDPHEGIVTPEAFEVGVGLLRLVDDTVTRVPDGILVVGWIGYRIIQPVGVGR